VLSAFDVEIYGRERGCFRAPAEDRDIAEVDERGHRAISVARDEACAKKRLKPAQKKRLRCEYADGNSLKDKTKEAKIARTFASRGGG
jgi:hypothetical protein